MKPPRPHRVASNHASNTWSQYNPTSPDFGKHTRALSYFESLPDPYAFADTQETSWIARFPDIITLKERQTEDNVAVSTFLLDRYITLSNPQDGVQLLYPNGKVYAIRSEEGGLVVTSGFLPPPPWFKHASALRTVVATYGSDRIWKWSEMPGYEMLSAHEKLTQAATPATRLRSFWIDARASSKIRVSHPHWWIEILSQDGTDTFFARHNIDTNVSFTDRQPDLMMRKISAHIYKTRPLLNNAMRLINAFVGGRFQRRFWAPPRQEDILFTHQVTLAPME